jgi:hypothetical protein
VAAAKTKLFIGCSLGLFVSLRIVVGTSSEPTPIIAALFRRSYLLHLIVLEPSV